MCDTRVTTVELSADDGATWVPAHHVGTGEPEPNRLGYGNNQIHVVQLDLVAAAP